ncbi:MULTISPECIES: HEPN domain-containing protein [Neisseria]|uniref:HEPN domain-containing protein n=1 Tax=Neisseria macacae ATCC 33926 TaxID=997348 RepID=A0ABY3YA27_9NEIS|nr:MULTISPECIES: HEPN domain-containing protein [Neisseria]UNV85082.1 HEPN domain-containing protein [Neisseria macacae ATCC 33926]
MITAIDFLHFADSLCRNSETDDRVCISRAYYAAMHHALEKAINKGYQRDKYDAGGTHKNLIFYYERQADDDSSLIADLLKKLRKVRSRADYELVESIYSSHAKTAIKQAKEIFSLI